MEKINQTRAESYNTDSNSFDIAKYPLLSRINTAADLRKLPKGVLPDICKELRKYMIANLSVNPGHFASSMGAVEITVALHYVFNTPYDRIVWDVGHQAYSHKILTGRRDLFPKIRTKGGISGFPNPAESEFDTFSAGHAGNSISAALGMAIADSLTPENTDRKTVAVIGDASISNGLAFEGLNNASNNPNNLLIILNDNDMSIDDNVGAFHRYISDLQTSSRYNRWRNNTYNFFKSKGLITEMGKATVLRFNNSLKALISQTQNIFEGLNIRYFGPFDGHDVFKIITVLEEIKNMTGPRLLHLRTKKGKGYDIAEKNPSVWHAPGKFNPETGERLKKTAPGEPLLWQEVFGKTLVELADKDDRILGITAAMLSGTSMSEMMRKYPNRTFDVGISEGHAVTFAGGLASMGKRPFVAIYSSFLQRAYDNIINDIAIQGLPVTFCIDRAGIVGEDGVTHHGLFDLAYMRLIPGIKIAAPANEETLRNLMFTSLKMDGPMAIRYPRGKAINPEWQTEMKEIKPGKARIVEEYPDSRVAVLALGSTVSDAEKALDKLKLEGVHADLYDMIWLKPIDTEILHRIGCHKQNIVTIEDGTLVGGLASAVKEWYSSCNFNPIITSLGIDDHWVEHGTVRELKHDNRYDADAIASAVRDILNRSNRLSD